MGETKKEKTETKLNTPKGAGLRRAHEAIGCLKRIPMSDGLRKRGFQVVMDWIRHNG